MFSVRDTPLYADLQEVSRFVQERGLLCKKCAWVVFAATCLQLTFLHPYIVMIPGERANVFSAVLCTMSLLCAWAFMPAPAANKKSPEFLISIALSALMALSSVFSSVPGSSSIRAFTILASGLGGFWCARIMLADERGRRFFRLLSVFALTGLIVASLSCYYVYGNVFQCVDWNPHPLACKMLLLWFAPLSLIIMVSRPAPIMFSLLIVGSYAVFYLSHLRSACLIPLALLLVAFLARMLKLKYMVAVLIPLIVLLVVFFLRLPVWKISKEYEPAYYRFESYFFSLHVAMQHPWLGIGIRAPRDKFLEDYEVRYPYVTKDRFAESVNKIVTSENAFLTFLVGAGFPFTLLYVFSLIVLMKRLIRQLRGPPDAVLFHPIVLLLPITAGLLHFQIWDGLCLPQVNWFFHILLGLIVSSPRHDSKVARAEGEKRSE